MNPQPLDLLDLRLIVGRARLGEFLEEIARCYEAGVLVLDRKGGVVVRLGEAGACPGPGELAAPGTGVEIRPILAYRETVGHVLARSAIPEGGRPAEVARHLANLLSEFAAREFELNDLSREILDSYEAVNLFYDVAAALPSASDVNAVCAVILEKACEIIRVRRASILLLDAASGELVIAASKGLSLDEHRTLRVPIGTGISGQVLRSRMPRLVDDVRRLPGDLLSGYAAYATRSFISVPLCLDSGAGGSSEEEGVPRGAYEGAIGVVNMTDREDDEVFSSMDLKLLTALGGQAAVLIQNIRLVSMEKEIRIARSIQQGFLPSSPPEVPGVLLAGTCRPARNVGGDYFDFLVDEKRERVATVVADVSGHNIASALLMAVARSAIRGEIRRSWSPGRVLERLNGLLFEDLGHAESFLSVLCCVYEPATGVLRLSSAGHHPMLVRKAESGECLALDCGGLLMGVEPEEAYPEQEVVLSGGDTMLLYTDGLTEARQRDGGMFGADRLRGALESGSHLDPESLLQAIFAEIHAFTGERAQADDMTAVVLKVDRHGGR